MSADNWITVRLGNSPLERVFSVSYLLVADGFSVQAFRGNLRNRAKSGMAAAEFFCSNAAMNAVDMVLLLPGVDSVVVSPCELLIRVRSASDWTNVMRWVFPLLTSYLFQGVNSSVAVSDLTQDCRHVDGCGCVRSNSQEQGASPFSPSDECFSA